MHADIVFENGPVFRGLTGGTAQALAVADGRVIALDDVAELIGPETRRVDLAGRLAIPAFHEAHMHLLAYGLGLSQAYLRADQVRTLDELLARMRTAAALAGPEEWVLGRGYDHTLLDIGRHPTAEELDAAVPDRPAFITRACGHMGVANSAALRAAGLGHNTPDPEGGVIGRRAGGALTGLLQERAMGLLKGAMPAPSVPVMTLAIEAAGRSLAGMGYASASDMAVGMTAGSAELDAYAAADCVQRMWVVLNGGPDGIADAHGSPAWRPGDDAQARLRIGAVKVFGDGSAGGLTAAFFAPYRQGGHGVLIHQDAAMHEMLARYAAQGWQLAIHAIGDAAVEQVLSGMEAAGATSERRHRIEHCGFATAGQRARMATLGIVPVPQPIFLAEFGAGYVTNLGEARAAAAYPMRTWMDAGMHPSASSDAPVSSVDPFAGLHAMTERELGADQRLTMAEAIHAMTWCAAYASFAEGQRGTLEVGMDADIAVLSRDILTVGLNGATCDLTLRGGQVIHGRLD